jgi:hypothetical protein
MKFPAKAREFFWPLLGPLKKKDFELFRVEDLTIKDDDLDTCYDLTLRYYDSENERKKIIESKSTIFIGSIGFVIAILLSMATGLLLNPKIQLSFLTSFSILMWVVIVIYFCRAVWFSIKALERQEYNTISHSDYVKDKKDFKRELITDIINKTRNNSRTINLKVDNMVMAQEYFKRGIIAVVLYSLIAGIYGLISKSSLNYQGLINTILLVLRCNWVPILNGGILLINIAILILLYARNRKG